jgi:hypothetical protein
LNQHRNDVVGVHEKNHLFQIEWVGFELGAEEMKIIGPMGETASLWG